MWDFRLIAKEGAVLGGRKVTEGGLGEKDGEMEVEEVKASILGIDPQFWAINSKPIMIEAEKVQVSTLNL